MFIPQPYRIPAAFTAFLGHAFRLKNIRTIWICPVQWHAIILAVFASVIAPFGGFFASGFKRAFKLKDFSDSIPGHGGITDRMDCQFLNGLFAHLYLVSFIKRYPTSVGDVLQTIITGLPRNDQLLLYNKLQDYLIGQGILEAGPFN